MASKRGSGWQAHPASCARKPLRREPLLPSPPASTQTRASSCRLMQACRNSISLSSNLAIRFVDFGLHVQGDSQDRLLKTQLLKTPLRAEPCRCYSLRSNCLSSSEDLCAAVSLADSTARQALRAMSESHNLRAPFYLRNPSLRKFHAPSASSDLHRATVRVLKRAVLLVGAVDRSALVVLGCLAVMTSPSAAFSGPQGRAAVPLLKSCGCPYCRGLGYSLHA